MAAFKFSTVQVEKFFQLGRFLFPVGACFLGDYGINIRYNYSFIFSIFTSGSARPEGAKGFCPFGRVVLTCESSVI